MFKRLDANAEQVLIELDGAEISVPAGVSVAAALLAIDTVPLRQSAISGSARAPFCMMGICFECLVEIDGVSNQRACQVQVRPGMRLCRQLSSSLAGDA